MIRFQHLSPADAREKLTQGTVTIVDIRDPNSFAQAHIQQSQRLDNSNVDLFLDSADKAQPLIVVCYHGNSSQNAAQFFAEQGFNEVYSLDGGFEAWRGLYPELCETSS